MRLPWRLLPVRGGRDKFQGHSQLVDDEVKNVWPLYGLHSWYAQGCPLKWTLRTSSVRQIPPFSYTANFSLAAFRWRTSGLAT
jgi:hypothetical protein